MSVYSAHFLRFHPKNYFYSPQIRTKAIRGVGVFRGKCVPFDYVLFFRMALNISGMIILGLVFFLEDKS